VHAGQAVVDTAKLGGIGKTRVVFRLMKVSSIELIASRFDPQFIGFSCLLPSPALHLLVGEFCYILCTKLSAFKYARFPFINTGKNCYDFAFFFPFS